MASAFAEPGELTIMTTPFTPVPRIAVAMLLGSLPLAAPARARAQAPPAHEIDAALRAIDDEYSEKVRALDQARLARLQRIEGTPDYLGDITKPLTKIEKVEPNPADKNMAR